MAWEGSRQKATPLNPPMTGQEILSPVHEMLSRIERVYDAHWLNKVCNDIDVLPWVKGWLIPPLDLSAAAANRDNICLSGEHGAMIFHQIQPGLMELHSMCLKRGRGKWMLAFAKACEMFVFTKTNCVEMLSRCPAGNVPARALARALGWTEEFVNPRGWVVDKDPVPATIVGLRLQDWARSAPGLEERGHWFHVKLEEEFKRHGKSEAPHPGDAVHDRYVGLAFEMLLGGQAMKAQIFYQRFCALGDYVPFVVINESPLTIDIQSAIIIVKPDGDFWCPVVR